MTAKPAASDRPSRGEGREALVKAATAILTDEGLRGVSHRSVAARAGVTHGLVRHHFRSIGELLGEAVVQWGQRSRRTTLLEPGTGRVEDIARNLPQDVEERRAEHIAMYEVSMAAARGEEMSEAMRGTYTEFIDAVSRDLKHVGIDDSEDQALARVVFAAIDGLVLQQLIFEDPGALESGLERLRLMLAGIAPAQD